MAESEINNDGAGALKRVPPLTVENILKALEGVKDWREVARWLVRLRSSSSLKEAVEWFLQGQGNFQPSWRAVVFALDVAGETPVASRIRSYGEPVQDSTLMTGSVAEIMELVNNWGSLEYSIYVMGRSGVIPNSRLREIQRRCSTKREIAIEYGSYYVHCHPRSSWTHLASHLYSKGEFAAVEKLKPFLPHRGWRLITTHLR